MVFFFLPCQGFEGNIDQTLDLKKKNSFSPTWSTLFKAYYSTMKHHKEIWSGWQMKHNFSTLNSLLQDTRHFQTKTGYIELLLSWHWNDLGQQENQLVVHSDLNEHKSRLWYHVLGLEKHQLNQLHNPVEAIG